MQQFNRFCPTRLFLVAALLTLALAGVLPIAAQDGLSDDERALITAVQDAYAQLDGVTYRTSGSISGEQTVTADFEGGYRFFQTLDVTFDYGVVPRPEEAFDDLQGTTTFESTYVQTGDPEQSVSALLENVLRDGAYISRVTIDGIMQEWIEDVALVDRGNIPDDKSLKEPFLFLYLLDKTTAAAISAGQPEERDGQMMQPYTVDFDSSALRDVGVITPLGIGTESLLSFTATIDGFGTLTPETSYSATVWVGMDDGLPHYASYSFSNDVTAEQGNARAVQSTTGEIRYTDFGAEIVVIDPRDSATAASSELAALVVDAYTGLQDLSSYTISHTIDAYQLLDVILPSNPSEIELQVDSSGTYVVVPDPAGLDSYEGSSEIYFALNRVEQEAEFDTIAIGEDSYTRVTAARGINVSNLGEWSIDPPAMPGLIPADKVLTEVFLYYFLAGPDTIAAVNELTPETGPDGAALRVFDVQMSVPALREIGMMTETSIGEGSGTNLTASFDGLGEISSDAAYTLIVRIDEADSLVRSIDLTYTNDISTTNGSTGTQVIAGTFTFTDLGASVIITPPQ
ncbi:MAG: hypothetical protein ACOCXZ_01045 [Chloroflexota bacterium]